MLNPMQNSAKRNYARFTPESRTTAKSGLSPTPEVLELGRRQFGISHGVLNGLVAEIILNPPRIVACIGQGVAAGMPQHMNVDREAEELLAVA